MSPKRRVVATAPESAKKSKPAEPDAADGGEEAEEEDELHLHMPVHVKAIATATRDGFRSPICHRRFLQKKLKDSSTALAIMGNIVNGHLWSKNGFKKMLRK